MCSIEKLRVLVVDDDIIYRKILSAAINATGMAVATQTASNGIIALERLAQQSFDVVLLDVVMPEKDGLMTLKEIKRNNQGIYVIMISSEGPKSASNTIKALTNGALDFILKPSEDSLEKNIATLQSTLQAIFFEIKVKIIGTSNAQQALLSSYNVNSMPGITDVKEKEIKKFKSVPAHGELDLVVIAASTGGPEALGVIISSLPENFTVPILLVQHMPENFTDIMAKSLNRNSLLPVREARMGEAIAPSQVLLAPGGKHMSIKVINENNTSIQLEDTPLVNGVRPAADVLFRSIAEAYCGKNVLAIILTGMGCDGKKGVLAMKQQCHCYCITQSERTSAVYGMPYCVVEAGLSDEIMDLKQIPERITRFCNIR